MAKSRAPRRRRRLRARPLLVAAGTLLAVASVGCGTEPFCQTHGTCAVRDMAIPAGGISVRDLATPADLTPRGD